MDTGSGPEGSALHHTGENYNIVYIMTLRYGMWGNRKIFIMPVVLCTCMLNFCIYVVSSFAKSSGPF